ncbi:nitroreductase family deazaflavin-dependent oxidoreductase [Agromyces aurantiacus]|uniref:Nitroreductase family deazaflavin-dependent oxidoreductase n=1 Tax=Agromyces aurantiacus TaxID=165814 RepID=A0ABV9RAK2_9MICO|nr:nitroreductase family deazaflavin-dependent oxidoreductase [Agromyces aurantiacus]MBM7504541.1 deazaflavin-dependent oxidoreductase (nitroreductase family) [Agromyces aurantiacus]
MVLRKPGPAVAWFNRMPVYAYRAHLGRIMGPRFVMITALGRSTGALRRTVVEAFAVGAVPDDDALPVLHVVASRGRRSDWYANATAGGRVRVDWMSRRGRADVHRLDVDERAALLTDYALRRPKAAALLTHGVLDEAFTGDPAQLRRLAGQVRALRLEPVASAAAADVAPER